MTVRDPRAFDGTLDRELDAAIRALRDEHGSEAQALALEQRLLTQLGPAAFATTGVVKHGASSWLHILLALSAVSLLVQPDLPHTARVAKVRIEQVVELDPRVVPEAAVAALAAPVLLDPVSSPAAIMRVPKRHARAKALPQPVAALPIAIAPRQQPEAELALLLRAREALRSDPHTALAIVEQHAASYPDGLFAQEREVLAVEALLRTRDRAQAFTRAEQFLSLHPRSAYSVGLRTMLDQRPRGADTTVATQDAQAPVLEPR